MFDEGLKGPLSFVDALWSERKAVASARARVNGGGSGALKICGPITFRFARLVAGLINLLRQRRR